MKEAGITLHPIAAELAAAIERSPDQTRVFIAPEVIEKTRARLRAVDATEVVPHLIALAVKTKRVAGMEGGLPVLAAIALLVTEKIGSAAEAADAFGAAGIDNAAALIGASTAMSAPREQPKAAPIVKAKRGLSKS